MVGFLVGTSTAGMGLELVVDSVEDGVDVAPGDGLCLTALGTCTLRAAVQEANALVGVDVVALGPGVFGLDRPGTGEDLAAVGDLDVRDDLEVVGAGEAFTTLDAEELDRMLEVVAPGAETLALTLRALTVQGGRQEGPGGCLYAGEDTRVELERVTFRNCRCTREGCAVFNAGTLVGEEASFVDNGDVQASGLARGGALANIGSTASFDLTRCVFQGNTASNGGAVYIATTPEPVPVRFERCSFLDNEVFQLGGAIHLDFSAHLTLESSTLAGNVAGAGGGLFNDGGGVIEIRSSTVHGNHALSLGGGIGEVHFSADHILMSNSIVAGNTAVSLGPDCHLTFRSEGATLIGDPSDCTFVEGPGDLVGVDPQLGPRVPVGRGGGHYPGADSPALDAGGGFPCPAVDQAGRPRNRDSDGDGVPGCDLGALELGGLIFESGFESGGTGDWSR